MLVGGDVPSKRLAIHQRHYGASLVRALLERFPATVWPAGSPFVTDAGVRIHTQPATLRAMYRRVWRGISRVPRDYDRVRHTYLDLRQFAELERQLGWLALAVEVPALSRHDSLPQLPEYALALRRSPCNLRARIFRRTGRSMSRSPLQLVRPARPSASGSTGLTCAAIAPRSRGVNSGYQSPQSRRVRFPRGAGQGRVAHRRGGLGRRHRGPIRPRAGAAPFG